MKLLAIECSHRQGSVAIETADGTRLREFPPGLVHGRELLPAIDHVVTEAGWTPRDLQAIAVSNGPGSYTGVRIGVAAAKALAWSLAIPAVAVSSLEAIAQPVPMEANSTATDSTSTLAVVVDARRGTLYGATFTPGAHGWQRLTPDRIHPVAEFFLGLDRETRLVGSGARTLAGAENFEREKESFDQPDASSTLAIALNMLEDITKKHRPMPAEYSDPHLLAPVYLRPSEAEEKRHADQRKSD